MRIYFYVLKGPPGNAGSPGSPGRVGNPVSYRGYITFVLKSNVAWMKSVQSS